MKRIDQTTALKLKNGIKKIIIPHENKKDLKLIALVVKDGTPPDTINFENSLLVIGSEAHGIPTQWAEQCEEKLTLPMPGNTESLNAAVAGSIAIYLASK